MTKLESPLYAQELKQSVRKMTVFPIISSRMQYMINRTSAKGRAKHLGDVALQVYTLKFKISFKELEAIENDIHTSKLYISFQESTIRTTKLNVLTLEQYRYLLSMRSFLVSARERIKWVEKYMFW